MTTIAYRNGELASDTGASVGDSQFQFASKISRNRFGDLSAAAGRASYGYKFRAWFVGGENGEPPAAGEADNTFDRGVIFRRAGTIEVYEPEGMFLVHAPYFAMGSGRPEALGAFWMNATAKQAVMAAIAHDAYTFGEVEILRHDRPEPELCPVCNGSGVAP